MSALGHKRTFAVHQPMSALPLIATSDASFQMSAKGQKWTQQRKSDFCWQTGDRLNYERPISALIVSGRADA
jgi:hypothetical protein